MVGRDREADLAILRAVQNAAERGDHAEAASLSTAAIAQGLEHPLLLNLAALKFEQDGNFGEAEKLLARAVELAPGDIGSRNALALCLRQLERPEEALSHFNALLELDESLAFVHTNRGNTLRSLGAVLDAEASFRRALELDPNQAVAQAGLANIQSSRGAYPAARMWARRALSALPNLPDAVLSLAAAELGERRAVEAETLVRSLLDQRISVLDRAYANGLLGDILDAQGRYADAFAAYSHCNSALSALYAGRFDGADSAFAYVESMLSFFEAARPEQWRGAIPAGKSAAQGHIFLLGFPRCGTTLLEVILEGHPAIVSLEERESLIGSVREFMGKPRDLERLLTASPAVMEQFRADYWRRVEKAGVAVSEKIFVDKHPFNTLKLPLIARLFPDAKILFACRDPRDIVLSCFRHRFQMSAPTYELLTVDGAANYYAATMRLLVQFTRVLPLNLCLIRHEDLVTEFAREMKRICRFLGIEWVPAMGDFALRTRNRAALTPSTSQLVRGLNTEGLGQWRRYRSELATALPVLDPWIKRFLYEA